MYRRVPALAFFIILGTSFAEAAPTPPELRSALSEFRTEGPKNWAFVQTTTAEDKRLVENFDPRRRGTDKWVLVEMDGNPPTENELESYREKQAHRLGAGSAPNVKDQLDYDSCELISDDGTQAVWRFRLLPGGFDDNSAEHMAATFTFHRPTGTIQRVELASIETFSPTFVVKIEDARTLLEYSLPEGSTPSLLQTISVRIRGRAFYFKSLDSDLTVSYSEYENANKAPLIP